MESRKRRALGVIMSDETPASTQKPARDQQQLAPQAEKEKLEVQVDAHTAEIVAYPRKPLRSRLSNC